MQNKVLNIVSAGYQNLGALEVAVNKYTIDDAKSRLEYRLKLRGVKEYEGIGILYKLIGNSKLVVNFNKKAFEKYSKKVPDRVLGFNVEKRIIAKAVF